MCNITTRLTKLSQIAAQAEYELSLEIGSMLHYGKESGSISLGELAQTRRKLVLRGDAWAISAFDRIRAELAKKPELCEALAKERAALEYVKSDAVREYLELPQEPAELLCAETADMVRRLEAAGIG